MLWPGRTSRSSGGRAGRSAAAAAGAAGDWGSLSGSRGRRRRGLLVEGVEDGVGEPGHDGRRGLGALDGTRGGREELQGFGVGADDVNEQVGGPAVGPRGAVAMVLEPLEERRVGGLLVVLLGRRGGRGGRVGGQNCVPPLRLVVVQLGSGRVKLAKLGECGLSRGSTRAIGQCLDGPADGAPEGQAVGPPPRALGMKLGELRCREGGEARPVLGEARAIFLSALRGAVQEHVEVAQPEVLDARLDVPPD